MNLKAPVIINKEKRKGIQIVLDTDKYSVRHLILDELKRREVSANAGSDT
jgi:flagellar assembly factor FliW